MMDEIPEDIQQTATRFAGEYLAHDISCERLYRDVAALLVAERERCARIAEQADIDNATAIWVKATILSGGRP